MPRPGQRPQLRTSDFGDGGKLQRPLNDALSALAERLDALESSAGILVPLPPVDVQTLGTTPVGVAPWPRYIQLPDTSRPLVGLVVLRVENLSVMGVPGMNVSGRTAEWEPLGDGRIAVQYVTALTASTSYRITFGAVYGR